MLCWLDIEWQRVQRIGAAEARWAHNPKVEENVQDGRKNGFQMVGHIQKVIYNHLGYLPFILDCSHSNAGKQIRTLIWPHGTVFFIAANATKFISI